MNFFRAKIIIFLTICAMGLFPITVNAQTIKTNKWYSGTVFGGHQKKLSFTMPYDGYIVVENLNSGVLACKPKKHKGAAAEAATEYNWLGNQNGIAFPDQCYQKGDKLSLIIRGYEGTVRSYKVRIRPFKKSLFERESNNKKKKATALKTQKTYVGCIGKSDTDWFVFKAKRTGRYVISADIYKVGEISSDNGLPDLHIVTYSGKKKLMSKRFNGKTIVFSGMIRKGKTLYFKLSPVLYSDMLYRLRVA